MPFFGLYRYKICTYLYTDILAMMIINLKTFLKRSWLREMQVVCINK